jgi:hypothetical protein
MYINHDTGEIINDDIIHTRIDPNVGLYVLRKDGTNDIPIKIRIPSDCCAVQMGECLQIITGGMLKATPHCVRGISPNATTTSSSSSHHHPTNIARISLPCFVDTIPSFPLQCYVSTRTNDDIFDASINTNKVPPLHLRYNTDHSTTSKVEHEKNQTKTNDVSRSNHGSTMTTEQHSSSTNASTMTFGDFLKITFQMYYDWNEVV